MTKKNEEFLALVEGFKSSLDKLADYAMEDEPTAVEIAEGLANEADNLADLAEALEFARLAGRFRQLVRGFEKWIDERVAEDEGK